MCRKKVQYIHEAYNLFQDTYNKVAWIDVDCSLDKIPDFLIDFDIDIIGFPRGFQNSQHQRRSLSRYWEPCFLVFATNERTRQFLYTASTLEREAVDIAATDDYFFEEAWRKHRTSLTHFCIPGEYSNRTVFNSTLPKSLYRAKGIFFEFGSSGSVDDFRGKVKQHEPEELDQDAHMPVKLADNPVEKLLQIVESDHSAILT